MGETQSNTCPYQMSSDPQHKHLQEYKKILNGTENETPIKYTPFQFVNDGSISNDINKYVNEYGDKYFIDDGVYYKKDLAFFDKKNYSNYWRQWLNKFRNFTTSASIQPNNDEVKCKLNLLSRVECTNFGSPENYGCMFALGCYQQLELMNSDGKIFKRPLKDYNYFGYNDLILPEMNESKYVRAMTEFKIPKYATQLVYDRLNGHIDYIYRESKDGGIQRLPIMSYPSKSICYQYLKHKIICEHLVEPRVRITNRDEVVLQNVHMWLPSEFTATSWLF